MIGSGREELVPDAGGFAQPTQGGIAAIEGAARAARPPCRGGRAGIGYVPRERRTEGLVLFLPVAANITLASLGRAARAAA